MDGWSIPANRLHSSLSVVLVSEMSEVGVICSPSSVIQCDLWRLLASAPRLDVEDGGRRGPSISQFMSLLKAEPRVLVLLVCEDEIDGVLALLQADLSPGDIVVSGGAENSLRSVSRALALLSTQGVQYIDCSRPFMGKLNPEDDKAGLVLLVGSEKREAAALAETALSTYGPCTVLPVSNSGSGSGQYLRLAHDGLQTALVQLHCEVHRVLCALACGGAEGPTPAQIYDDWVREDEGRLFTPGLARALPETSGLRGPFAFVRNSESGGGESTAKEGWLARECQLATCPLPTITAALEVARLALPLEVDAGGTPLTGPGEKPQVAPDQVASDCRDALRLCYLASYAQIFALLQATSCRRGWEMDLGEVARAWQCEGCGVGSSTLRAVAGALPGLKGSDGNVLSNRSVAADASRRCSSLRRIVTLAVASGIPVPCLSATTAYLDTFRQRRHVGGGEFESSLSSWM